MTGPRSPACAVGAATAATTAATIKAKAFLMGSPRRHGFMIRGKPNPSFTVDKEAGLAANPLAGAGDVP